MRPNAKTSHDVIQTTALPNIEGMEFDYRTSPHGARQCYLWTMGWIAQAIACAFLFTLILRTIGLYLTNLSVAGILLAALVYPLWSRAPFLLLAGAVMAGGLAWLARFPTQVFCLAMLMACFAVLSHWSQRWATVPSLGFLGGVLLLWALSVLSNTALFAGLLFLALACTLILCDAVTHHYASWMNANPKLSRRTRKGWLAIWQRPSTRQQWLRFGLKLPEPRSCRNPILYAELRARARYLWGYLVVLLVYLVTLLFYVVNPDPVMRGPLAVSGLLITLIAFGVLNILVDDSPASLLMAIKVLRDSVISWFTYNVNALVAPGVFRSPSGTASRRLLSFQAVTGMLTIILLPACWYFSICAKVVGIPSWLGAATQTDKLVSHWTERDTQTRLSAIDTPHELMASPERALAIHGRALLSLRSEAIVTSVLSLGACLLAPFAVLVSTLWAISSRVLLHHHRTLEGIDGKNGDYHSAFESVWQAFISRLRESRFATVDSLSAVIRERDHVLFGFAEEGDYPILVSKAILSEHAHITGDSGSGKSSLGITPLAEQLIARGDCSVVILDLKNDMSVFEAARTAAERVNATRKATPPIPFRWFTNEHDRSTFLFNPMTQRDMQALSPHQRTEVLLTGLGLDYGEGFGPSYFSSAHRHVLQRILDAHPHLASFRQINSLLRDGRFAVVARDIGIDRKAREEAEHLYTVIASLASIDAFNVVNSMNMPNRAVDLRIDMADIVRKPQITYFGLTSAIEPKSVREIAKLALHTLLLAAVRRRYSSHQTFLIVDEFQQVVSHDLEIVLRQARSHGISAILANQTLSDLKTGPIDITPTVQANTRLRHVFSASDVLHQNALIEASGEAIYELEASSHTVGETPRGSMWSVTHSTQEHIGPRLRRNDVIEIADHPLRSILQVTRGHGFTQFGGMMLPMRSMYHVSAETYTARRAAPWPRVEDHPGTVTCPLDQDVWPRPLAKAPATSMASVDDPLLEALERSLNDYQVKKDEKHDRKIAK